MKELIPLSEISEIGIEKSFENQAIWLDPIKEFGMSCEITEPLKAQLFMMKLAEGCLIKGTLTGKILLSCDRCAEKIDYTISTQFEEFEEVLQSLDISEDQDEEIFDIERSSLIIEDTHGILKLDISSLLWEEFSLAIPMKPLCSKECKGVCLVCGINKNVAHCQCDTSASDPRFDKLKNLKITKTK